MTDGWKEFGYPSADAYYDEIEGRMKKDKKK